MQRLEGECEVRPALPHPTGDGIDDVAARLPVCPSKTSPPTVSSPTAPGPERPRIPDADCQERFGQ